MKKIFYEKHIKKFIEDSDKLQNYILLEKSNNIKNIDYNSLMNNFEQKSNNIKNIDYNSLMNNFEQNKENIKIGIINYLRKATII